MRIIEYQIYGTAENQRVTFHVAFPNWKDQSLAKKWHEWLNSVGIMVMEMPIGAWVERDEVKNKIRYLAWQFDSKKEEVLRDLNGNPFEVVNEIQFEGELPEFPSWRDYVE